jgi:S1-C subfamily serine protease
VVVSEVVAGSAAAKAGLRPGDRILRFNGREVRLDADLQAAVMIAPPRVTVLIEHPGEPKPVEVTIELKGVPFRVGITWRVDDGEPGSVIITHVVDGSPAAKAGVKRGDRIYQVNGRDFSGELELFERLRTFPGPLRFQVERAGQLRSIDVSVEPAPLRKAA